MFAHCLQKVKLKAKHILSSQNFEWKETRRPHIWVPGMVVVEITWVILITLFISSYLYKPVQSPPLILQYNSAI